MTKPAKKHSAFETASQTARHNSRDTAGKDVQASHLRLVEPSQKPVRASYDDLDDMWDNVPI